MKERPILFSGEMVRAILSGAKTQTRRLYRPRPCDNVDDKHGPLVVLPSPYGSPGDRLWVRETWTHDHDSLEDARAAHEDAMSESSVLYRASMTTVDAEIYKWRPSIYMPRWASRITLEVTDVRVERLQAISEADARAEGVAPFFVRFTHVVREQRITSGELARDAEHRASYAVLWDELNADRAPWASNPWVWVVTFEVVT